MLPIPVVWRLQLNRRTRISLAVVLSLGWFACIAAILKLYKQTHYHFGDNDQNLHDTFFVWSFVELSIGIIAASLPMLKPLLAPIFGIVASEVRRQAAGMSKSSHSNSGGAKGSSDRWGGKNVALENISAASATTASNNGDGYRVFVSARPTGREEKEMHDIIRAGSEDRILPPSQAHTPTRQLDHDGIDVVRNTHSMV